MQAESGKLYLIPTTLGDNEPMQVLPVTVQTTVMQLQYFFVENEKSARRFIKTIAPQKAQSELILFILNKYADIKESSNFLDNCAKGISVGLLSEAGTPAIADPGAHVVMMAHERNIKVVPLVGPSSIVLAMMSSGLNGQNFAFNGYLPIESNTRKAAIKDFEKTSKLKNQAQIFIETPYRNNQLLDDLKKTLNETTYLCVASELTLDSEYIKTLQIKDWKRLETDLHKKPAIFILQGF